MEPIDSVSDPIIQDPPDHHKPVKPVYLWVLFGILAGLTVVTVVMAITTVIILDLGLGHVETSYSEHTSLPTHYAVPPTHLTPVKPIAARPASWVFATVSLAEAALRKQATELGVIAEDEYIALSEQAYGKLMFQLCSAQDLTDQQRAFCDDTRVFQDPTKDGFVEMLYYFRDRNTGVFFPDSVCNYTSKASSSPVINWRCDGADLDSALSNTPFRVHVSSIANDFNPDAIKRRILETQLPLSFGHAELGRSFLFPCDEYSPFAASADCTNHLYPCATGYCCLVNTASYTNNGSYVLNGQAVNRGDHHMLIVGWNDEFRGGGFILRNNLGTDRGHSIGYLVGNYSLFNEDQLCPSLTSFTRWIPATYECLQQLHDPAGCPNITRTFVKKPMRGSTVLRCADFRLSADATLEKALQLGFIDCGTEEGRSYNYVLESSFDNSTTLYNPRVDFPYGSDGYGIYHLIRWHDGEEHLERVQTNYTTETLMEQLFVPRDLAEFPNSINCGNYFMPYDVFLEYGVSNPAGGFAHYVRAHRLTPRRTPR